MAAIWILKAIIQKGISALPFKHQINYYFQKHITRGLILSEALFEDKLTHCANHLKHYMEHKSDEASFKVFELGTGWYPIIPVGLFLAGAEKVYTADLFLLINKKQLIQTMEMFLQYFRKNKLHSFIPQIKSERVKTLENCVLNSAELTFEQMMGRLKIQVFIGDAGQLNYLKDKSIDLITSNNTFEHIHEKALMDICTEMKRIIKPTGVMSHFIDLSDHYAHLDSQITVYNFLKFSDWQWKLIDNSIQPMNRMRVPDYRKIFHKAGFIILHESNRTGQWREIQDLNLDTKFKEMALDDLLVSHAHVVLKTKSGKLWIEKEEMLKELENVALN